MITSLLSERVRLKTIYVQFFLHDKKNYGFSDYSMQYAESISKKTSLKSYIFITINYC